MGKKYSRQKRGEITIESLANPEKVQALSLAFARA